MSGRRIGGRRHADAAGSVRLPCPEPPFVDDWASGDALRLVGPYTGDEIHQGDCGNELIRTETRFGFLLPIEVS